MSNMLDLHNKDHDIIKDFQKWAISQNYTWSGALDVWISAYNFYTKEIRELRKENNSLRMILKSHSEIIIENNKLREQLTNAKGLMATLEGDNRL